ncbi:MAG: TetR/AcrR family transcriptional regulator [Pseudomonadota bacterium]
MLDSKRSLDDAGGVAPWTAIGRPAKSARQRILVTAIELFCRHGYEAIGVDVIAHASGASKSTIYKHFDSKEKLIAAVLEEEGATWRAWFYGELGKFEGDARDRVLGLFEVLESWFSDPNFYGCAFLNAISEAACDDQRPRALADVHKSHLLAWLHAQALELGAAPKEFTQAMIVLIDGAIMAAHASKDATFAKSGGLLAASLLDTQLPAAGV